MTRISFFLFFIFVSSTPLLAQNASPELSRKLVRLTKQLDEFESKQQEILKAQEQMIEEIKDLKIQARR